MVGVVSKPGVRLRSVVSDVEIVVVRPTAADVTLTCGAVPMIGVGDPAPPERGGDAPRESEPVQLGKRYFDETTGLEVLCAKGGAGPLAVDGRTLPVRGAQPLPASD